MKRLPAAKAPAGGRGPWPCVRVGFKEPQSTIGLCHKLHTSKTLRISHPALLGGTHMHTHNHTQRHLIILIFIFILIHVLVPIQDTMRRAIIFSHGRNPMRLHCRVFGVGRWVGATKTRVYGCGLAVLGRRGRGGATLPTTLQFFKKKKMQLFIFRRVAGRVAPRPRPLNS